MDDLLDERSALIYGNFVLFHMSNQYCVLLHSFFFLNILSDSLLRCDFNFLLHLPVCIFIVNKND